VAAASATTPIAPRPEAGSHSKAIPAPSPATAMKVMALGAKAARAPPDAARRARKHHVVPTGARADGRPSNPTTIPAVPMSNHFASRSTDTPIGTLACSQPEESDQGGEASRTEQMLSPRPHLGSELGGQPHGDHDPTRQRFDAVEAQAAASERRRPPRSIVARSGESSHREHRSGWPPRPWPSDEGSAPGVPGGDVVNDAEPSDGGLPSVPHPQDEAHPGTDAEDQKDGSQQAGLGDGPGTVTLDGGEQPGSEPRTPPMHAKAHHEHQVIAGAGMAWMNWAATQTVTTKETATGLGHLVTRIWRRPGR